MVALVAGLGVLILAGLLVVAITLAGRLGGDGAEGFGEVMLPLPEGCTIAEATSGDGQLILRLEGLAERGCGQVVVLDMESGRELGRIVTTPQP